MTPPGFNLFRRLRVFWKPKSGRSAGEGIGYPLQYFGLENSMDYSPWGHKESDTTEQLSLHFTNYKVTMFIIFKEIKKSRLKIL